ncbi:MAG: asparagine synthase (glutamine-hydrolyzing) [Alphaproteobacteria bacterium]|nr:asparagine synthase (glutamine-hydrolyzing) [Alphaproteobacteria bacterium]
MCGIAGYFLKQGTLSAPDSDERLARMAQSLRHRGPQGEGLWSGPGIGFAHRRLKILDLSDNARQPMTDDSGKVHIVFNGEIYNFQELREELAARGVRFKSTGDTEVLLKAYLEWGDETPEKLIGMFAFAVFDARDESLFLARDRFGEKPLFYAFENGAFLFASEIKALLTWPGFRRRANSAALHRYLTYQYTPSPHTAFDGIQSLPPATRLRLRRGDLTALPKPDPYWRLPDQPTPAVTDPIEAAERLREHLILAVKRQRISDVPLGLFLSGGVDSSAIAHTLRSFGGEGLKAFTVGFEDRINDERHYARLVAEQLDCDHYEFFPHSEMIKDLFALDSLLDEPFADPAILPAMQMSRLAKQHVDVALSGDGGDEVLLGYPRYAGCKMAGFLDVIPQPLRFVLSRLSAELDFGANAPRVLRYVTRLMSEMAHPTRLRYANMISFFSDADRPQLYADGMAAHVDESVSEEIASALDRMGDAPIAARAAAYDLTAYLPNALMTKTDRASMAYGLEVRCPFLDHELVEFCASLPASLRLPGTNGKAVLIDSMQNLLPEEVLLRDKVGLSVPLAQWLRTELWTMLTDSLSEETVKRRGLFNHAHIVEMLNDLRDGGDRYQYRLWALLRLERWFETWVDA